MSFAKIARCAAVGWLVNLLALSASAADPAKPEATRNGDSAKVVTFHGYANAIQLTRGNARAVLCPEVGGRVLQFSIDTKECMFLEEAEKTWQPGQPRQTSAGRFDYGPELTVIPHPEL